MGTVSKLAGRVAKAAAAKAAAAAKHKANGGCPGSKDGKHNYRAERMRDVITGKKGFSVTYCRNNGCGRVLK